MRRYRALTNQPSQWVTGVVPNILTSKICNAGDIFICLFFGSGYYFCNYCQVICLKENLAGSYVLGCLMYINRLHSVRTMHIYPSRTSRLPILSVVCKDVAIQSKGQLIFSEVTRHASAALSHHPWHPGGLQEVHLKIWLWIWGQRAPPRLHNWTVHKAFIQHCLRDICNKS